MPLEPTTAMPPTPSFTHPAKPTLPDMIRGVVRRALRYLMVSPLPHLTATASAATAWLLAHTALEAWAACDVIAAMGLGTMACGWVGLACIALADGFSRWREYGRVRRLLARHGFQTRILRAVSSSRCQRDMALAAAGAVGRRHCARRFFHSLGYRWYHLLPDAVMRNPLAFFDLRFLTTSFLPSRKG